MKLADYQKWSVQTAIYPGAAQGTTQALSYVALGLVGEAGEVANKAKKLIRDGDTESLREQIRDELGDVCWYMARMADELGIELEDLLLENQTKILSRQKRGVLNGSGDER